MYVMAVDISKITNSREYAVQTGNEGTFISIVFLW